MNSGVALRISIFLVVFILIAGYNLTQKYSALRYFITNNMYLIISILIYGLTNELFTDKISDDKILLLFLFSLILIVSIFNTDSLVLKHIIWLLIVISLSFIGQPFYQYASENYDMPAVCMLLYITGILFLLTSLLEFTGHINLFTSNTNKVLLTSLSGIIIYSIISMLFGIERFKIVDVISIILFTLFFISDYQNTKENIIMNNIITDLYDKNIPLYELSNFTTSSLSSFLDIINIFNSYIMLNK